MSTINSNPFAATNSPATAVPPGSMPTDSPQNSDDVRTLDERSSDELNADADRFSSLMNDRAETREPVARHQDWRDDGGGGGSDSSQADPSGSDDSGESYRSATPAADAPVDHFALRAEFSATGTEAVAVSDLNESDQSDPNAASPEPEFTGQAILQSMIPQSAQAVATSSAAAATSATPATTIDAAQAVDALATQIADRILVSEPGMSGADEVRILLKDSVLPQTEVRFSRDGGTLQVEFVTQSDASFDLLQGHQNALQDRLARKTDQSIKVAVTQSGQQDASGDGRSRQRQEVQLDESSSKPVAK